MSLVIKLRHKLPNLTIDADFTCEGGLTALYGASGSGKTTVVNLIAGLLRPASGCIRIGDDVLFDSEHNINLPPHKRRIGYVFQDARLFPHLSVQQNLKYGRWFAKAEPSASEWAQMIDMLGLAPLLRGRPATLSGGEKQRVAIGRALLASPRLLLMDEPLASLDEARKLEIMPYIERLRDEAGLPIIHVSHSVPEVARLATQVVVMEQGRTLASGPAGDILRQLDLLTGDEGHDAGSVIPVTVAGYDAEFDMTRLSGPGGEAYVLGQHGETGTPLRLRIRSRDVMLALEKPHTISALTIFEGKVSELVNIGTSAVRVTIDCGGTLLSARITRMSQASLKLKAGSRVYAIAKAVSLDAPGQAPRI